MFYPHLSQKNWPKIHSWRKGPKATAPSCFNGFGFNQAILLHLENPWQGIESLDYQPVIGAFLVARKGTLKKFELWMWHKFPIDFDIDFSISSKSSHLKQKVDRLRTKALWRPTESADSPSSSVIPVLPAALINSRCSKIWFRRAWIWACQQSLSDSTGISLHGPFSGAGCW